MPDPVAILARLLAVAWAGLWLFFFVAESWATHTPLRDALPWVGLGLLFLIAALAAWHWERSGGILLAGLGLAVAIVYITYPPPLLPSRIRLATALFFGVPPVLAGVLFALHHRAASR
jgi:hypothetical protein